MVQVGRQLPWRRNIFLFTVERENDLHIFPITEMDLTEQFVCERGRERGEKERDEIVNRVDVLREVRECERSIKSWE